MAKKKPATPVEVVVIADRSGSMAIIASDAIGGFNTFLKEQQSVKGEANLTLVLFDDQYEVPVNGVPIKDVQPLTAQTYIPRGSTSLNDAIGKAIAGLEAKAPEKAIVCILTDGQENTSKEYTSAQCKAKITAAEARGWQIVYLAANQDAFAVGANYGVLAANTANFAATGVGVRGAMQNASLSSTNYRTGTL